MKKSLAKIKKPLQWDSNHIPVSYVALRLMAAYTLVF